MSEHTPGPWTPIQQANGQWFVMASSGYPVARVARWTKENDAADASLLASAPDLRAHAEALAKALERAISSLEQWAEIDDAPPDCRAREVIAEHRATLSAYRSSRAPDSEEGPTP